MRRRLTEEHKRNISKGNKGNKKLIKSLKKFFKEVGVSDETRKKLSIANSGVNNGFYGKKHSPETIKKIKNKLKKIGHYAKLSKLMKVKNPMFNVDNVNKMRLKQIKNWENNIYRKKVMRAINQRPNKPEALLILLFEKNGIQMTYVGDGKEWFTGIDNYRYNPDFINKDKKIILEFFGSYWHNIPKAIKHDKGRIETYKKKGYKVIIVWENELNDIDKLKRKIINFAK